MQHAHVLPALSDFVKGAAYFWMELERAIELVLLERGQDRDQAVN